MTGAEGDGERERGVGQRALSVASRRMSVWRRRVAVQERLRRCGAGARGAGGVVVFVRGDGAEVAKLFPTAGRRSERGVAARNAPSSACRLHQALLSAWAPQTPDAVQPDRLMMPYDMSLITALFNDCVILCIF